jgi:hypothetical protein
MLENYFEKPFVLDRLRSGPSGPYIDGFAQLLDRQGYSWWTAQGFLRAAAHLGQFAQAHGIPLDSIGRSVLEDFRLHRPSCRCPRSNGGTKETVVRGAKLFVAHLSETGVLKSWEAEEKDAQHPSRVISGVASAPPWSSGVHPVQLWPRGWRTARDAG